MTGNEAIGHAVRLVRSAISDGTICEQWHPCGHICEIKREDLSWWEDLESTLHNMAPEQNPAHDAVNWCDINCTICADLQLGQWERKHNI